MQYSNSNTQNSNYQPNSSQSQQYRGRQRARSNDRRSYRSNSKPRIDFNAPENKGKCEFHIRYGENTWHCIRPCTEENKPLKPKPERTPRPHSQLNPSEGQ